MGYLSRWILTGLAAGSLSLAACLTFSDSQCSAVTEYALHVVVTDSLTGRPPAAVPSLTVTDGDFSEVHPAPNFGDGRTSEFLAARQRPGVYQVVVRAAGYRDWTRSGIRVELGGECLVLQTAFVSVRLQRS